MTRVSARRVLGALAILLLASLLALHAAAPPPVSGDPANRAEDQADVVLYETIVEAVRHGGAYYAVTAEALRSGDYPLKPFITFRLPTLAMIEAAVPGWATLAMLYALAAATMLAWASRLQPVFARTPPLVVAIALLGAGMVVFVQPELSAFQEPWAALLVALSLAVRRPGRWIEPVAFGLAAVLIRETAAPYLIVMAIAAMIEGDKREATGWGVAIGILAVALAFHAHAVNAVVGPLDPASSGWWGMLGPGFFVGSMTISTALDLAPLWLAAPIVVLALFGWSAWRDPLATRVLALFAVYGTILSTVARPDNFYWGWIVAPILLIGLAFVPDALRDLIGATLDRRRITVTRVAR